MVPWGERLREGEAMEKKNVKSTLSRLKGGLWVTVDEEIKREETIEITPFESEAACVALDAGMTVNMGNYQSAKVGVMIAMPCYPEEFDAVYKTVKATVEKIVQEEVAELMEQRKKM